MCASASNNEKNISEEIGTDVLQPITRYTIFKNLLATSVGSLLLITMATIMELSQSTLNVKGGVGVASLAVQYASNVIVALFLPKYLIKRFGNKAVILFAMLNFVPFIVVNYYPKYPLMILSAICFGTGIMLFNGTIDSYLNDLAMAYTQLVGKQCDHKEVDESGEIFGIDISDTKRVQISKSDSIVSETNAVVVHTTISQLVESVDKQCDGKEASNGMLEIVPYPTHDIDDARQGRKSRCSSVEADIVTSQSMAVFEQNNLESNTNRFFGFYGTVYQSSSIVGNLLSYFVLQSGSDQNHNNTASTNDTCFCGADYCTDKNVCLEENLQLPSTETRNLLLSICLGLCVISFGIVIAFFSNLKPKDKNVAFSLEMLFATFRQTQKRNHLFLIPLTIHTGMMSAFYVADFTKSYVSCAWGVHHLGLVASVSGCTTALSAACSGWAVRYTGRRPIFVVVAALNVGLYVMLLEWRPDPERPKILFLAAFLYGTVFGSYYTLIKAFYGILFKEDEEAAFGVYQVWQCVGTCLSLGYSGFVCNYVKLYIMIAFCALGMVGYFLAERSHAEAIKERSFQASSEKESNFKQEELTDTFTRDVY